MKVGRVVFKDGDGREQTLEGPSFAPMLCAQFLWRSLRNCGSIELSGSREEFGPEFVQRHESCKQGSETGQELRL